MLIAPVTETDRLTYLRQHDMLPFLQDDVFDEFVGLAARIFSLPISLFNLVDAHQVTTGCLTPRRSPAQKCSAPLWSIKTE
jgi:hypothetical protein